MKIFSFLNILINIRTLLSFIMYKASYFFDFLIKLLFVKIINLVYDKLKIYRDIPQGKLKEGRENKSFIRITNYFIK
jgi:hypothetical protein